MKLVDVRSHHGIWNSDVAPKQSPMFRPRKIVFPISATETSSIWVVETSIFICLILLSLSAFNLLQST
jgi:hypothetical protein